MKNKLNVINLVEAMISIAFSSCFIYIGNSSKLKLYVNPKLTGFVIATGIVFLIIGLVLIKNIYNERGSNAKLYKYIIFILPLVLFFSEPQIMSTSRSSMNFNSDFFFDEDPMSDEFSDEELENISMLFSGASKKEHISFDRFMEEKKGSIHGLGEEEAKELTKVEFNDDNYFYWIEQFFGDDENFNLENYIGKEIKIEGMIYRDPNFNSNQFVIGKNIIFCCVVDGQFAGFLSEYEGAEQFATDSWVEVTGLIDKVDWNGEQAYIKVNSMKAIDAPESPYIYP